MLLDKHLEDDNVKTLQRWMKVAVLYVALGGSPVLLADEAIVDAVSEYGTGLTDYLNNQGSLATPEGRAFVNQTTADLLGLNALIGELYANGQINEAQYHYLLQEMANTAIETIDPPEYELAPPPDAVPLASPLIAEDDDTEDEGVDGNPIDNLEYCTELAGEPSDGDTGGYCTADLYEPSDDEVEQSGGSGLGGLAGGGLSSLLSGGSGLSGLTSMIPKGSGGGLSSVLSGGSKSGLTSMLPSGLSKGKKGKKSSKKSRGVGGKLPAIAKKLLTAR